MDLFGGPRKNREWGTGKDRALVTDPTCTRRVGAEDWGDAPTDHRAFGSRPMKRYLQALLDYIMISRP